MVGEAPFVSRKGDALAKKQAKRRRQAEKRSPEEAAALRDRLITNQYNMFVRLAIKQYVMLPGHAFCTDPSVFKAPEADECYGP